MTLYCLCRSGLQVPGSQTQNSGTCLHGLLAFGTRQKTKTAELYYSLTSTYWLHFPVFTDVAGVFLNWRQDLLPAKKIMTCFITMVWNQTCNISLGMPVLWIYNNFLIILNDWMLTEFFSLWSHTPVIWQGALGMGLFLWIFPVMRSILLTWTLGRFRESDLFVSLFLVKNCCGVSSGSALIFAFSLSFLSIIFSLSHL